MTAETVLVTGGTGTVGRALVDELAARLSVRVRVLTRNPLADLPPSVERHVGDFMDPSSLEQAMAGCTRLFLLASGTQIMQQDAAAVSAAVRAGVRHVVKLSALGVGRDAHDPITRWHRGGEETLQASGPEWTMLRPTGFMSNALEWAYSIAATGTVTAPFPDGRTALIDPADVAAVAAIALTEPGQAGQIYELTGPEPLTPADQVSILAGVLGRPIDYQPQSADTARQHLERYGMPVDLAAAVIDLLASAHEPWNGQPLATVEQATGRPPATFRAWAEQHRAAFTAPAGTDMHL
jgi:(4-alkanoyl-5-oxo-2,5-dihydrofuran-3-yl)methyl phosphate reductase